MTVISELSRLESAGLIRLVQYEPELEYLFRHALVQDAAYGTLLRTDRKRLHHAVGEAVEALYANRLDELAPMLARHFQQSGDEERALAYYVRAGDCALASFANEEAESLLRSALALSCSQPQRALLLGSLGEALFRQSRLQEAMETWQQGIDTYRQLDDRDGVARLYARSARAAWFADDTPGGLRLCQEGLEAIAGAPESADQARLIHEAARAYLFNGYGEEAIPLCQEALEMAERMGAVDVQADTLTTIGILPGQAAETTLCALRKAVELVEGADMLQIGFRAYHNLGIMTGVFEGDLQKARGYLIRAAEMAHQRGSISEELVSQLSVLGYTLGLGELAAGKDHLAALESLISTLPDPELASFDIEAGRTGLLAMEGHWPESLQLLRQILPEARRRGNLQAVAGMSNQLAGVQMELVRLGKLEAEDRDAALAEAETALNESKDSGAVAEKDEVGALCLLSTVQASRGRFEEARHLLEEARAEATAHPTAWTEHSLQSAERDLAEAEGRWGDALALTEKMAAFQARLGRRWHWARTLMDWAAIHAELGEPTDLQRAQALLREARSAFTEMGASGYAQAAHEQLDALRAEMHARLQAQGYASRELAVAGRVQEGLLPKEVPVIPGWKLAATLEPARETSGDFYDFIPLPGGLVGLVVADVADKGAGAALYMALSRTLLRTYATRYPSQPDLALDSANQRIVAETRTGMFVTVFYAVLDTETGTLRYCNAGHIPPLLLGAEGTRSLERTGLPLGILEDAGWETGTVDLAPGDALVLYTDGVTEAQARDGVQFGQERLLAAMGGGRATSAEKLRDAVLAAVHEFMGNAPRFDDVTLMVVHRE